METDKPQKSHFLRNATLTAILGGTAVMGYDVFKDNPLRYENKPAVERRADEEPVEEDNSGTYLSVGLAAAVLAAGTWGIGRFVKKPWLLYTVINDYLARRKQAQEQK
jgi:hypothetical protein